MSALTILGLEEKIKANKVAAGLLENELIAAKRESPDHQLAKELHGMLCQWNHTDGCGWHYEMKDKKDDWCGHAHSMYLKKAQALTHKCTQQNIKVDDALTLYKLVKSI